MATSKEREQAEWLLHNHTTSGEPVDSDEMAAIVLGEAAKAEDFEGTGGDLFIYSPAFAEGETRRCDGCGKSFPVTLPQWRDRMDTALTRRRVWWHDGECYRGWARGRYAKGLPGGVKLPPA